MIQVPLNEVKDDLSRYLRLAETEDVVITRHGVPAGILIGLGGSEDWWEDLLLRHPLFQERIAQARQSLREGSGIPIEQLREKYAPEPKPAKYLRETSGRAAKEASSRRARKKHPSGGKRTQS